MCLGAFEGNVIITYLNPAHVTLTNIYSAISGVYPKQSENEQGEQTVKEEKGRRKSREEEGVSSHNRRPIVKNVLLLHEEVSKHVLREARWLCSNHIFIYLNWRWRTLLEYSNSQGCLLWLETIRGQHCLRRYQIITFMLFTGWFHSNYKCRVRGYMQEYTFSTG